MIIALKFSPKKFLNKKTVVCKIKFSLLFCFVIPQLWIQFDVQRNTIST